MPHGSLESRLRIRLARIEIRLEELEHEQANLLAARKLFQESLVAMQGDEIKKLKASAAQRRRSTIKKGETIA